MRMRSTRARRASSDVGGRRSFRYALAHVERGASRGRASSSRRVVTSSTTLEGRLLALEEALSARFARVCVIVFALALGVRALVQVEIDRGPCAWQHRWVETDMAFFDEWARAIVAGDVLSEDVGHPFVGWHASLAERYFANHPDELARWTNAAGEAPRDRDAAARALWDHWYGGKQLHQEPLYPYLVAATYRVLGLDPRFVFAWQGLLGAASAVLVAWLAFRAFGAVAGALAGVLCATCAPLVFHEVVLLRTTTIVFLSLACAAIAVRAGSERGSTRTWIVFGLVSGLAALANSTTLPLALALAAVAAWKRRGERALLARRLVGFAAAVVLVLVPVVVRNAKVGAPLLSTSSVGALAFICANTGGFQPSHGFGIDSANVVEVLHASDDRLLPAIPATLSTHASVGSYLRQLASKLDWAWRWYEMPNNENLYSYERFSRVLSLVPVRFGLLAPLALAGIVLVLASSARRRSAELLLLLLATFAPLLAFYVLSRFRAPFVAACVPFAAYAIVELVRAIAARRLARGAAIACGVALAAAWTSRPLPAGPPEAGGVWEIRLSDWSAPFKIWYVPRIEEAARANDWDAVVRELDEAVEHFPDFVRDLRTPAQAAALDENQKKWVRNASALERRFGDALERAGRASEAPPHRARSAELDALVGPR